MRAALSKVSTSSGFVENMCTKCGRKLFDVRVAVDCSTKQRYTLCVICQSEPTNQRSDAEAAFTAFFDAAGLPAGVTSFVDVAKRAVDA